MKHFHGKNSISLPHGVTLKREDLRGTDAPPRLSIIVPTRDGYAGGLIDRLRCDLAKQTFRDFEFILVIGDKRQGRAINTGVAHARGEIIMTMDDDTVLLFADTVGRVVRVFDEDPRIGMAGASTVVPPWASPFQRRACREIPRRHFPIVKETVDSDMVQHPCLAMPKKVFLEISGEDEELIRGLDPVLRYKTRRAGYRVVIAANAAIAHMLPDTFRKVFAMYFRNGRGSAFAKKFYADRIYDSAPGFEGDAFKASRPFAFRVLRRLANIVRSIAKGETIRLGTDVAYTLGFLYEYFLGTEKPEKSCRAAFPGYQ
jgi:GT2 family glycosyltransferase